MNIEEMITKDIADAKQSIQSQVMHMADVNSSMMRGEITTTEYMAQLENTRFNIQIHMNRLADCAIWRDLT